MEFFLELQLDVEARFVYIVHKHLFRDFSFRSATCPFFTSANYHLVSVFFHAK